MGDAFLLFAVLAALYLWECACWIRRGSVAFVNWFGKHWGIARPGEFIGNQQGGFVFANPLPPLGSIVSANQFPFSVSTQGVLTWVSTSAGLNARPIQTAKFFPFDEINNIAARGRKLFINDQPILKSSSTTYATYLARQLERVRSVAKEKRTSVIEEIYRESLDTKAAEKLWSEFQKDAGSVRWLACGLFLYLFAFAPVMIWHLGLRSTWLSLLIGLLVLTSAIAIFFYRTHRKFYPAADDDRFTHTVTVLLAPATSIRARDILSRPLLETFHPLAIAQQFCDGVEFHEFAGKMLRDLQHPVQPACPSENAEWKEAELFSRQTLQGVVETFLKQNKVDPEKLCSSPKPADETCRSYCPRCLAQFTVETGVCADCGGLELRRL